MLDIEKEIKSRMWELCDVEKFGWWYNVDHDDYVFLLVVNLFLSLFHDLIIQMYHNIKKQH